MLLAALLVVVTAASAAAATPAERADRLERKLGPSAEVDVHRETGRVRFVGSAPGRPLARPGGVAAGAGPSAVARAFLGENDRFFGIRDAGGELAVEQVVEGPRGGSSVRLAQEHEGIPVLGGELIVNVDRQGLVLSSGGEVAPSVALDALDLDPSVSAAEAERTARAVAARAHSVDPGDLDVAPAHLEIYDSRLLGGPGLDRPILVWRTEVTGGAYGEIEELVLVDAQLGVVALHFNQVAHAKNRSVCDANGTSAGLPCARPILVEGGGISGVKDVDDAYDFAGDTYDFFFRRFGRDSLDGGGLPLISTARYCPSAAAEDCPYDNAFWSGRYQQMVYGEGMAADDVVGHELTHGFTDFTSGLFYYYQSGAINESLSDVFGEFVDQTNGDGDDTGGVRWQIGEDVTTPVLSFPVPLRDMSDPTLFGDPDRMTSPNYEDGVNGSGNDSDAGGVHTNSGVNNKAAYLMTDGDAFNGQTVGSLGIDKVALIYYTVATTMLTSASDYADLAAALNQACANLAGTAGITAADCTQVAAAVQAVEMDQQPPAAPATHAPVCAPGDTVATAYYEDFENPLSGRWARVTDLGANVWAYSQNEPDGTYARSGVGNLWGFDPDGQFGASDSALEMNGDIVVPVGGFMHFESAFGFDDDSGGAYDGGVLEYSTDGGGSWNDAGGLFLENGYTGTIASGSNPLNSRVGFVRESNGYISTRLDLRSLAGQRVRFRFRIGTDGFFDVRVPTWDYGWFVDDVRIYSCASPPPPPPPPPPPAPPIVEPPESPPSPRARAALGGRRRAVARRGRVRFVLRCKAEGVNRCRGVILLGKRGSLGRKKFSIRAGRKGAVVVRLSRKARRALARRGAMRLAVTVRTRGSGGGTQRAMFTIVVPRRR